MNVQWNLLCLFILNKLQTIINLSYGSLQWKFTCDISEQRVNALGLWPGLGNRQLQDL